MRRAEKTFYETLQEKLKRYQSRSVVYSGFLGRTDGVVASEDLPDHVYIRMVNGEVMTAYNQRVPNVFDLPVYFGYDPAAPKLFQVLSIRPVFVTQSHQQTTLNEVPDHDHAWDSRLTTWVRGEQFLPGLVQAKSGMTVCIYPFEMQKADGSYVYIPYTEQDLTSYVPTSGACVLLIAVDDTGAFVLTASSTVESIEYVDDALIPISTDFNLAAVRLYAGMSAVKQTKTWNDVFDLRWGRRGGGSGGGGGTWGNITGTLADQTDLQTALDAKAPSSEGVTNGNSHDHSGGDGAQISHADLSNIGTLTHPQIDIALPLQVKNTSGATANANDTGYLVYTVGSGYEYKTTTTEGDNKPACVVLVGGANNSTIYVVNRGRFTINYSGSAPVAGDYLVLSSTAGKVVKSVMCLEVMAVAMAAGSSGTVDALLLTQSRTVRATNDNTLLTVAAHSTTRFTSTIANVTATTVTFGAVTVGSANVINNSSASEIVKQVLWNTTRGSSRLITACNTGTSVITNISSVDSWAIGDTITVQSPTITDNTYGHFIELDISQSFSTIPRTARLISFSAYKVDTALSKRNFFAPIETFANGKLQPIRVIDTTAGADVGFFEKLRDYRFAWVGEANGTGTSFSSMRLTGYVEAIP